VGGRYEADDKNYGGWIRMKRREREKKKKKSVCREEREVVQPPHEVVRRLFIVEMVVDRPVLF
jgi:hypothetical protein